MNQQQPLLDNVNVLISQIQEDDFVNKRKQKTESKTMVNDEPQNFDKESRLKSVQEIYDKLDDIIDNSNSIKSQNGVPRNPSTKLGAKRSAQQEISQDKFDKENSGDESENEETKVKRLVQNRKSAQKCRLKKKAEFQTYKEDVNKLSSENKELKEKLNQMTTMLYNQIEENQTLHKRIEQNQTQHTVFLTKLLLNQQQQKTQDCQSNQDDMQAHLQSYLNGCSPGQQPTSMSNQNDSNAFQSQLMSYLEDTMANNNPHQKIMNALQTNMSCASQITKAQSPINNQFGLLQKQPSHIVPQKNQMMLPNSKKLTKSPELLNQSASIMQGLNFTPNNCSASNNSPKVPNKTNNIINDFQGGDMNNQNWQLQSLINQGQARNPIQISDLLKKMQYQKMMSQKGHLGMKL